MKKIKVVHYINNFFAGVGGEETEPPPRRAATGPTSPAMPEGPPAPATRPRSRRRRTAGPTPRRQAHRPHCAPARRRRRSIRRRRLVWVSIVMNSSNKPIAPKKTCTCSFHRGTGAASGAAVAALRPARSASGAAGGRGGRRRRSGSGGGIALEGSERKAMDGLCGKRGLHPARRLQQSLCDGA